MKSSRYSRQRPLAFEDAKYYWNIQRVPGTLPDGMTRHPGLASAIFVVHGIGKQCCTETAAQLRAGFEDALEDIAAWQKKHPDQAGDNSRAVREMPPPFIFDGYWADYDDIRATFPEDWERFNERERKFFDNLWKHRVVSGARTIRWLLGRQLRLLNPMVMREVSPFAWLLYWPFQIVSCVALLFAWVRHREAITGYLNDVRLYIDPQGVVERAIVQRIDERIEEQFLRMIGLDREFRHLVSGELLEAGGERLSFERVVWVAHSLGTVISYNVLSALFHKAAELESSGDDEQKEGVALLRRSLCRFVTLGSPLDKIAFLFKENSLRPWPGASRRALLDSGETLADGGNDGKDPGRKPEETEWWINFYHVFDPVSGALENPFICGDEPPSNIHIGSGFIPGYAHVAYWIDRTTLRFILGRTYGAGYLKDREYRPRSSTELTILAGIGYITWVIVLVGGVAAFILWAPDILRAAWNKALEWITG